MKPATQQQLIETIYAAAADPTTWTGVLGGLCAQVDASTASITVRMGRDAAVTAALPGAREAAHDYSGYWCAHDPALASGDKMPSGYIARARGLAPDFTSTPFYNEYARNFDRCDTMIVNLYKNGLDRTQILVTRSHDRGA